MNEPLAPTISRSERSTQFYNYVQRYKNLAKKRWWVLPLGVVAGLIIQGYRLWTAPPAFMSTGRMYVAIKINPQLGVNYMEEMSQFLGTQMALMTSPKVREKAYERVKALKSGLTLGSVNLRASVTAKTTIFNLQAIGAEPEFTRAYLDACMDEYLLLKKDMRTTTSEATLGDLTDQVTSLERDIKKYEGEELNFQTTNNIAAVQEQGNYAAKYLVKLTGDLAQLKTEQQLLTLLDLDQNLERQRNKPLMTTGGGDESEAGNSPITLLHNDYFKAKQELQLRKAELQEWSEYLKPKHPRMVALSADISRREKLLDIFKEQSQESLEKKRKAGALQIENLEKEMREWEAKSLELSKKMAEYDRIRDGKKRAQNLYDRLLAAMQTIGVDKDISQDSVAILDRASPAIPARDNPVVVLSVGAAVGLAAALGLLLLIERLDDRPTSFADLQDLFDENVLAQIPMEHRPDRNTPVPFIRPDDERHTFLEAYRSLRSSLIFMANEGRASRVILITSAVPSDGKSMTAANLAITLALAGSRVLLVDADLRKGMLHRHFGVEAVPGLTEILAEGANWRSLVRATATAKLDLLARGNTAHSPGEMFLSAVTLKLIEELSAEYQYVILDTPPVMAADDVASLSPHAEGVLFVIRANYTSGRVARAALDLLYQRRVNVLGLVFNGVQPNSADYYYYRYNEYYAPARRARG